MSDPIARYSFLPWLRQGLAASIANVDTLTSPSGQGERASIPVTLRVNDSIDITNNVLLYGPGDAIGIDARAIVRTDPKPYVNDFEPNYVPLIEFYDEDFPWRYTPATATPQHRLRPWLCLLVFAENEIEFGINGTTKLQTIKLKPEAVLPLPAQTWAWAHVHVDRDVKGTTGNIDQAIATVRDLLEQNSDLARARLICPRKLKPFTSYYACVVPTFELGRRAGLDLPIASTDDGLEPAWGKGQNDFPVYYQWQFQTGSQGDFEYLVRLLQPRTLDPHVGIRDMDVQNPGYGLPGITTPPALGLEGALKTPLTQSTDWQNPEPFQNALTTLVNLPEDLQSEGNTQDPIITLPLYGRWHALVTRLRDTGNPLWIDELNLDPRHRVPAGFGTRVVQENQEDYANAAWEQVGEIEQANWLLRRAQIVREASLALYTKHLTKLSPDTLFGVTAGVHSRVLGSPLTLRQMTINSALPAATVNQSFRRIIRPRGPVALRANPTSTRQPTKIVQRINRGEIVAAPPKIAPPKQLSLDKISEQLVASEMSPALQPFLPLIRLLLLLVILILTILGTFVPSLKDVSARLAGWLQRVDVAAQMRLPNLTPGLIRNTPPRPGFVLTVPGGKIPPVGSRGQDSTDAANFRLAALDLHERFQAKLPDPVVRQPLDLPTAQTRLLQSLNPSLAIPARIQEIAMIPSAYLNGRSDPLEPIMAAPDFPFPMYKPLRDLSPELMIPNLNLIPRNTISLLMTNEKFVEAYMVGLNHEMGRELLWREFPTDQRGSYFRQFWDVSDFVNTDPNLTPAQLAEKLRDIKPIHTWQKTAHLGDNSNTSGAEHLVLMIRGDLLRKYPTAVIYAAKAIWLAQPMPIPGENAVQERIPEKDDQWQDPNKIKTPIFKAEIEPDITFFGFDLSVDEAKGTPNKADGKPGWFFVIRERPGEPRFGLDDPQNGFANLQTAHTWNDLSWGHLVNSEAELNTLAYINLDQPLHNVNITDPEDNHVHWESNQGTQSADLAYIMLQVPVKVYIHASEMLP